MSVTSHILDVLNAFSCRHFLKKFLPGCSFLHFFKAKLGDEILDYRDLAALPKDKAIYNIDRPDMISYSPYISYSSDHRRSYGEVLNTASELLGCFIPLRFIPI